MYAYTKALKVISEGERQGETRRGGAQRGSEAVWDVWTCKRACCNRLGNVNSRRARHQRASGYIHTAAESVTALHCQWQLQLEQLPFFLPSRSCLVACLFLIQSFLVCWTASTLATPLANAYPAHLSSPTNAFVRQLATLRRHPMSRQTLNQTHLGLQSAFEKSLQNPKHRLMTSIQYSWNMLLKGAVSILKVLLFVWAQSLFAIWTR